VYGLREVGDGSWRKKAHCIGLPADFFFPETGDAASSNYEPVCGRCPVRTECLLFALRNETRYNEAGMMALTSIRMRRKIKRALRPRSPESLSVEELAIFMDGFDTRPYYRMPLPASPEVPQHEGDDDQHDPDPAA
jgi:hypothetical protein